MRTFITSAVLTVTVLTINAAPAFAQHGSYESLVDSMYHRYLGRHADAAGMHDHARALRHGTPIDVVEASILASPEYYVRNGNSPESFVAALYRDVLGRRISGYEFNRLVDCVLAHGRHAAASRVLALRAPVVVASPAPVIVTRPYVIEPTVIVPAHRHHGHVHGHGPSHGHSHIHVQPTPSINLRFNFGR